MLQDEITVGESHERFLSRVVASEVVWGIRNELGFQGCPSNENEQRTILLFWSDAAYARRAVAGGFTDCEPGEIPLFDFLFRWLPGMADDKLLAGTNYTGQLHGLELEPLDLQREILIAMSEQQFAAYRRRLDDGLEAQRDGPSAR